MCIRSMKLDNVITKDRAWKIPMSSGVFAFILGLSCFGVGMKLSEFKQSPSLPSMIAGAPMVISGIAGMVGGRTRKTWLITVHVVFCLIAGVLGLHLTFIFLGKEAKSRELYKAKCESKFKGTHYCQRYAATLSMTVLAVLACALAPMGIVCCAAKKCMAPQYDMSEEEEEESSTLDRQQESEATRSKASDHAPSRGRQIEPIDSNYIQKHRLQKNNDYCNSRVAANYRHDANKVMPNSHPARNHRPGNPTPSNRVPRNQEEPSQSNPVPDNNTPMNDSNNKHRPSNRAPTHHAPTNQVSPSDLPEIRLAPGIRMQSRQVSASNRDQPPRKQEHIKQGLRNQEHWNFKPRSHPPTDKVPSNQAPSKHVRRSNVPDNYIPGEQTPKLHAPNDRLTNNQGSGDHLPRNNLHRKEAPNNHLSGNQENGKKLLSKHPLSNPLPRNYAPSNQAPRGQTTGVRVPINLGSSNQSSRNQVLSNQASSAQAPGRQVLRNQLPGDQQQLPNHVLVNQATKFHVPNGQVPRNQVPTSQVSSDHAPSIQKRNNNEPDDSGDERQLYWKQNVQPIKVVQRFSSVQSSDETQGQRRETLFSNTTAEDSFL